MLRAAVACGEYAFAGGYAGFVCDYIARFVKLYYICKRLVVWKLSYAYERAFAVYVYLCVRFGVLEAKSFKLLVGDKFLLPNSAHTWTCLQ